MIRCFSVDQTLKAAQSSYPYFRNMNLGLPELFGRKKKDLFSMIVDRIKQKALSWSSRFLSKAGKLIMLKSVLSSMPTYTMTCFKLPNGLKPECLLARVLLGKYSHSSHFLDSNTPNSASHGWRGIGIGRDLLKEHCGKVIGNGASTSVWSDPWLSLTEAKRPAYEEEILLLKPSKTGAADKWAWLPTISGTDFNWKTEIWALKSSPKTKMLIWKAMQNAIPVGENLKQRNINSEAVCPHCGEEESTLHLFFSCPFATQICLPPTGLGAGPLAPWIIWSIWYARNQKIFNQRHLSPKEVVLQSILRAKEWQLAQSGEDSIDRSGPLTKPNPYNVDLDSTICHSDAAWDEKTRSGGFGWIFRNSRSGLRREGTAASTHIRSPILAEATAIRFALMHAADLGITTLTFASDSKQLIEAINLEIPSKEIHGIQHDILNLSEAFLSINFVFVPRERNSEADSLAKNSLRDFIASPN